MTPHIDTLGGAQPVHARFTAAPDAPVVGCLPALGIRAGYYDQLLDALAARGLNAIIADAPGHGDSPIRASRTQDWGYAAVVEHAHAVRRLAAERCPDAPFYWMGHSIGAHFALLHAGRADAQVDGLILIAAGVPVYDAWTGVGRFKVKLLTRLIGPLTAMLGHYPGERIRFGGREASQLMRDWRVLARTGRFDMPGFDADVLNNAIAQPILHIGIADDALAPPRAADVMLAPLASTDVIREVWPSDSADHNRWPRQRPGPAADRIAAWINARRDGRATGAP